MSGHRQVSSVFGLVYFNTFCVFVCACTLLVNVVSVLFNVYSFTFLYFVLCFEHILTFIVDVFDWFLSSHLLFFRC